jgi:hypothetical protein
MQITRPNSSAVQHNAERFQLGVANHATPGLPGAVWFALRCHGLWWHRVDTHITLVGKKFFARGAQTMKSAKVGFSARILRKQADLPRYVVKSEHVPGRVRGFPAEVMLNDNGPFPRNIRPRGKGPNVFFFNLTELQCRKAGLDTNDQYLVTIIFLD